MQYQSRGRSRLIERHVGHDVAVCVHTHAAMPAHSQMPWCTNQVEQLLDRGANITAVTASVHWTPLHTAAYSGMVCSVAALLRGGAPVDALDWHAWTPLHWAAYGGHADVCSQLVEAGAEIDRQTEDFKWSALLVFTLLHGLVVCIQM